MRLAVFASILAVAAACCGCGGFAHADDVSHHYSAGEKVLVYANKMGPFNNPLETYQFFDLPGCPPASKEHKTPSIGQALVGDELYETRIRATFGRKAAGQTCVFKPTVQDIKRWTAMVDEQYWYELTVDGMPVWATFGKMIDGAPHVYTQQTLALGYNGDRIVAANLTAERPQRITVDQTYEFTYSSSWEEMPALQFDDRFARFQEAGFFEHNIHWFSIANSFMMVLALLTFVLIILSRTLKSDYAKFAREELERNKALGLVNTGAPGSPSAGLSSASSGAGAAGGSASVDMMNADLAVWADETGWKQLSPEVHRVPLFPEMLCALLGQGWQLVAATVAIIALALVGSLHTTPGSTTTYFVFIFSLTSFLGGTVGGGQFQLYCVQLPPLATQRNAFIAFSAVGFSGFVLLLGFLMNFLAVAYDSAQAIPFWGMVAVFAIWAVVVVPLTTVGCMYGRHRAAMQLTGKPMPHVNMVPRLVPTNKPWYATPEALALLGGVLPFGSIFIELYYVFASFWGYKMYYVFGFLLLVVLMLLVVTACSCVVVVYLLLNGEDHRWQWTAFLSGASTGIYVFLFAGYYFVFKTHMYGLFMVAFYFGYSFLLSVGAALACGAVAFSAAQSFVFLIYDKLRRD